MPKIYFKDNGLRNALINNFTRFNSREDKGGLLENYVHNRLNKLYGADHLHYWRTADGHEVDFVIEEGIQQGFAYEVKHSGNKFKPGKYRKFTTTYPGFELQCVSKELSQKDTIEAIRL